MGRRHGLSGYAGGCRCTTCVQGKRAALRDRYRKRAYGRPTSDLVDAAPVGEHLRTLMAAGSSLEAICEQAGVSYGVLSRILYQGQRRVKANSAAALMRVAPSDVPAGGTPVCGDGTRRRARALAYLGWSLAWQARQLEVHPIEFGQMVRTPGKRVAASTAAAMRGLYDQYWDQVPEVSQAASQARNSARRHGYLPPAAWDDDLIDLPDDELDTELARRVELMEPADLYRAYQATREGDRSPLIVAAGKAHLSRRAADRRTKTTTAA